MLKLHLCVPNCCEGLLQHGKGKKNNYFDIFSAFLVNTDQMLFLQMGFPFCSFASASCVGPLHANRKP